MIKIKFYLAIICASITTTITNAKVNHKKHSKTELTGKATYYGDKYHSGRRTASGARFDKNKLTAAHKTLPFGTIVQVTNKKNGKTVNVEITDRGPYAKGKIIDLSVAAFREIASLKQGVVDVELKVVSQKH